MSTGGAEPSLPTPAVVTTTQATNDLLTRQNSVGRVLLVDSEAAVATAVCASLQDAGGPATEVVHVRELSHGLKALAKDRFSVVLTDLRLRDARGFDAVIRLHAAMPEAPIIVLTSLDDEAFALQALELGAQDYLVKGTFDSYQLNRSVSYAIHRKRLEQRLLQMAHFDELTGLRNRAIFRDRLGHLLLRSRRDSRLFALMLFDIEDFRGINATYGRPIGDELLRQMARRLHTCLRDSDTIARLGADQFAALLENIADPIATVEQRVCEALAEAFSLGSVEIRIRAQITSASYPADGETSESLLRTAHRRHRVPATRALEASHRE